VWDSCGKVAVAIYLHAVCDKVDKFVAELCA